MREHKKSHIGMISWGMFLAGALSLGSCSSDETLDAMEPKAITFGSVTMENHSRAADPSYGDNKLIDGFQVWGTVTGNAGSANIFNGATVTRGTADYGEPWTCSETQYWIPTATYNFMAIANANSVTPTSGMPTAINYTADGTSDLLLAEPVLVHTDDMAEPDKDDVNENGCVAFTMTHLLSKVHFTFQDSNGNPVTNTEISNIQVIGHYASGTYNIGGNTPGWVVDEDDKVTASASALNFGDIDANDTEATTSQYARLIIPGTQTWSITFAQNGTTIDEPLILEGETEDTGYTFAPNTEYNIIVTVGSDITFTVESLAEWNKEETNVTIKP